VTKELISVSSPEDKFAKQTGATKEAFETGITNVSELANWFSNPGLKPSM